MNDTMAFTQVEKKGGKGGGKDGGKEEGKEGGKDGSALERVGGREGKFLTILRRPQPHIRSPPLHHRY